METPSSTRRVTRSQTLAASANNSNLLLSRKVEESEKVLAKSRQRSAKKQQQDRSALIDITNDSPIVGLAMGNLETPSSAMSKKRTGSQGQFARTPGSGEALLRGQVKTLLQRVEEEAELSKITLENRPLFNLQGLVNSPINLVAPTPANTPQVLNLSANADGLPSVTPSPVTEKFLIPQMFDEKKQEGVESENLITRSLLLDFSEKSDSSECSSVVTYQGVVYGDTESSKEKPSTDDDDSSIWSIQVNASSTMDDDEEEQEGENCPEEDCDDDYYQYEEEEGHEFGEDNDDLLDELCEGISKISVKEGPKFEGKHIRFVYNSDDEIQDEEQVCVGDECESPSLDASSPSRGVLRLKGLPTPKGKHLRFPQESETMER
ncbi:chaperonin CPN60, mitochondrial [Sesamum indicum]|uniref:Chaperonin CPN60, mitochondrial n=1 Tax=Sesamum indicum TaxID=4182 RepID=A0A6I9UNE2_SESIN|nr:chaperonin CPN60, mitochondrial [Sesamum indicum]